MQGFHLSKRTWLLPASCLLFILFFTVFGERGLLRIHEMKKEKKRIEERVIAMNVSNQKLRVTVKALQGDRKHIESVARKELGLVKPNETIYQFLPAVNSK